MASDSEASAPQPTMTGVAFDEANRSFKKNLEGIFRQNKLGGNLSPQKRVNDLRMYEQYNKTTTRGQDNMVTLSS